MYSELHGQTGSRAQAAVMVAGFIAARLPRLLGRFSAAERAARAEIVRLRRAGPPGTLYLAAQATGGMGDYIVCARFLRDVLAASGPAVLDIYASNPAVAAWVFRAVPGLRLCRESTAFDGAAKSYDLALRVNQAADVAHARLPAGHPALAAIAATVKRSAAEIAPFIERHPFWDNFLARKAVFANRTRRDGLHGMAGIAYGGDALAVPFDDAAVRRHGLQPGSYITLHNGFDAQFLMQGQRATKCYPHFGAVVARLRERFPGIVFVQIGTSTSEAVAEAQLNLIGATTMQEAAGLVAHARLHIDNEGGLVHLARCYGVPSCVVFGPTPADYFAYPDNIAIEPGFCGGCWWIDETWMDRCPRGFATPRCLTEQDPRNVAAAITRFLAGEAAQPAGRALLQPAAGNPSRGI